MILFVCASGFVEPMLCTTSMVQGYVVHHQPAFCTRMSLRSRGHAWYFSCSSVPTHILVVHNIALYQLGGAQDDVVSLAVCLSTCRPHRESSCLVNSTVQSHMRQSLQKVTRLVHSTFGIPSTDFVSDQVTDFSCLFHFFQCNSHAASKNLNSPFPLDIIFCFLNPTLKWRIS